MMFMSQLIQLFTKKEGSVKNNGMHRRRGFGLVQAVYALSSVAFFLLFFFIFSVSGSYLINAF